MRDKSVIFSWALSFLLLCACLYLAQKVTTLKASNDYLKSFLESVVTTQGCHEMDYSVLNDLKDKKGLKDE